MSRADQFLARTDAHLANKTPRERRSFLAAQLCGWEHRYAEFIRTDGASEPVKDPANPPQAADFLNTIAGLSARLNAERAHAA